MKETLRQRLENEISRMDARCEQLCKNIYANKELTDYESAMKNDIKYRQLKIVSQSLKELLK